MSFEHAALVCDHFGLTQLETRYFLLLVQRDRAGNERLKEILDNQLAEIKTDSQTLQKVIPSGKKLTFEQKATFYSHWVYSAIRVLSSVPDFQTPEALATRLSLNSRDLGERLGFLLEAGLCIQDRGKIKPGPKYTHLENRSPLIARHHGNWRLKAMERHPLMTDGELSYTSPMSLSESDAQRVRALLVALVKEVNKIRDPSPCEATYYLNVDWLRF